MKYGLVAIVLAGAAAALSVDKGVLVTQPSEATPVVREMSAGETFLVRALGSDESCRVRKAVMLGGVAELDVEPGCDDVLPGLSRARHWQERDDGSVVISVDGGKAIVSFAVADGVAYESFAPRSPLISLIAEN
jgi:hypothetical protein